jgi:hypothetical protein
MADDEPKTISSGGSALPSTLTSFVAALEGMAEGVSDSLEQECIPSANGSTPRPASCDVYYENKRFVLLD